MLPTWVLGFPSGHECGEDLTNDLGGTKLRICWVTLNQGKGENHSESEIYHIPKSYKVGTADQLWSFLAESMEDFMTKRKIEPEEDTVIPLGFTFSYPATQEYIDQGVLQTWTKGFDIKGVEGHDVADQLRQALHQRVGLCIAGIDSYTRLTPAGITNPDRRSHQRHGRRHDRICIQ
jgi:hexokinase